MSISLIVLLIIISIIIIFIILGLSITNNNTTNGLSTSQLLDGIFSFHESVNGTNYVSVNDNNKIITSNSTVKNCNSYRWTYNQTDYTIVWGLSDDRDMVITNSNGNLIVSPVGTLNINNQWIYDNNRWCLKSDPTQCMYSSGSSLSVKTYDPNNFNFIWTITESLDPPSCVQNIDVTPFVNLE